MTHFFAAFALASRSSLNRCRAKAGLLRSTAQPWAGQLLASSQSGHEPTERKTATEPQSHRDTEFLCVFVSAVAHFLCALRLLRVDYSDTLFAIQPAPHSVQSV